MAVTLNQIAQACGLTAVTVSAIIRNPEDRRYAAKTREMVLRTAKTMNYVPNLAARSLRQGRSTMLALVIPWNNTELMDEVQRAAHQAGYGLIVEFTPHPNLEAEQKALEIALSRQVDGLIWMPANSVLSKNDLSQAIRQTMAHTVLLSFTKDILPKFNHVYIDYHKDLKRAVDCFFAGGFQEIWNLSTAPEQVGFAFSSELAKRCEERGMPFALLAENRVGELAGIAEERLRRTRSRIGIFGSDWACLEALKACASLGKKIPEEVGLLCFGDLLIGNRYRLGELAAPSLSSIQVPFGELGRRAVQAVVDRRSRPELSPVSICLPTTFVPRASTPDGVSF